MTFEPYQAWSLGPAWDQFVSEKRQGSHDRHQGHCGPSQVAMTSQSAGLSDNRPMFCHGTAAAAASRRGPIHLSLRILATILWCRRTCSPCSSTTRTNGVPLRVVAGDLEERMPDDISAHVDRTLAHGLGPALRA